jgi:hypothetical protein
MTPRAFMATLFLLPTLWLLAEGRTIGERNDLGSESASTSDSSQTQVCHRRLYSVLVKQCKLFYNSDTLRENSESKVKLNSYLFASELQISSNLNYDSSIMINDLNYHKISFSGTI